MYHFFQYVHKQLPNVAENILYEAWWNIYCVFVTFIFHKWKHTTFHSYQNRLNFSLFNSGVLWILISMYWLLFYLLFYFCFYLHVAMIVYMYTSILIISFIFYHLIMKTQVNVHLYLLIQFVFFYFKQTFVSVFNSTIQATFKNLYVVRWIHWSAFPNEPWIKQNISLNLIYKCGHLVEISLLSRY